MSVEFTGERVVPGQVDRDLWNEHIARYAFAARLARYRRVLDIGCGTGYGTAELAFQASSVIGLDVAESPLQYAREHFGSAKTQWLAGSATALPFPDGFFDLVVAFEVIEHLHDPQALIREARRVIAPGGQFIVSTPNKLYYAETRQLSGPNPYHEHEFEYEEFHAALSAEFPHVAMFLEDHTEGVLVQSTNGNAAGTDVRFENKEADPVSANFYIAVCAMTPQTGAPTFIYVPSSANILKERGVHIAKLEDELRTKNAWLDDARREHAELVERFRSLNRELEERNQWGRELNAELERARNEISALQKEHQQAVEWALANERRFEEKSAELVQAVEILHSTEKTLVERTEWALRLDGQLAMVQASRWIRLGRAFGVGPRLEGAQENGTR